MRPPQHKDWRARAEAVPTDDSVPSSGSADADALDVTAELLREREQLKHAMERRPVIDMARGVLMAGFACRPDEAWDILVAVSQHANVKVRVVAEAVTATVTEKPMPADLQDHLAAAVQRWQAERQRTPSG
ncbi:AmiR/NasT family two-component response regulator [Streptomyces sp. SAI-126]